MMLLKEQGPSASQLKVSLKPLLILSKYTGLAFFSDDRSKKLIICTRIFILILIVLFFIHELRSIKSWMSHAKGLHSVLTIMRFWYHWIVLLVNFLLNVLNNSKIAEAITLLVDLPITPGKSVYNKIYRFQIFIIVFNLIFLTCYLSFGHDIMWVNSNYRCYTSTIYILTGFFIAFSNIQFIIFLYTVKNYFKTVNDHLRKAIIFYGTQKLFFIIHDNHLQDKVFDIVKFRDLHLNLCSISSKLNECYTLQILLFMVLCMIEIIHSLRSGMIFIISPDGNSEWTHEPWLEILLILLWSGNFSSNLVQLVSSCDFTASEARETSIAVHELLNVAQDKNLERQLFSLQLMSHDVNFTAGKFFQLDLPLLHSIVGAITTYLVIIITFRE